MGRNVLQGLDQFLSSCHLFSTQYVEPEPLEVCFWVIYHRHPGLPVCLITSSSSKRQAASGPAARGALCVCIGASTTHIFLSNFSDRLIMYLLFKKEKQQLKSCREIKRIFCKEGSAVILKIHDNIMVDTWQGTDTIIIIIVIF